VIEMVRRFVRQKFGSGGLVAALVVLGLLEVLDLASHATQRGFVMASWAIFILAAGSVSRDVSSGALQMILSRPIRRTQYLFGRYVGILTSYAIFLVATSVLALVVLQFLLPRYTRRLTGIPGECARGGCGRGVSLRSASGRDPALLLDLPAGHRGPARPPSPLSGPEPTPALPGAVAADRRRSSP
jgi:hypothetical protein